MPQASPAHAETPDTLLRKEMERFVTELTGELGRAPLVLQGYPEVAMRVQQALSDENAPAAS